MLLWGAHLAPGELQIILIVIGGGTQQNHKSGGDKKN
jgi:hypothetical protein